MTSTTSEAAAIATLVKEQTFTMAEKYFEMATTALLIWHYVLTVENELAFFWRRRFSSAYALFVANRYLILVVIIYQSPWWAVHYSHMYIFRYLQYLVWAAFTSLRAYALQMQWLWAILVLALSLGPVAYGTMTIITVGISFTPANGCHSHGTISSQLDERYATLATPPTINHPERRPSFVDVSSHVHLCSTSDLDSTAVAITARAALVAAELIVMALTWAEMGRYRRSAGGARTPGTASTLSHVFYENGRVYLVLILVMHALYLVNWVVSVSPTTTSTLLLYFVDFSPLLLEPTIGILVSHVLIALHAAASTHDHPLLVNRSSPDTHGSGGSVSLVQFARADVDSWARAEPDSAASLASGVHSQEEGRAAADEEELETEPEQRSIPSADCHTAA
ncbi:uncharacterized protein TRAVEDRAFT_53550 [Trametes versicolor FP-101664 SS1]|uniref:uncharacterized protein n=1 Tax=Trametes versicolor (strain FP-101664) TaxID=717944 RepID=UPI0004623642|nr:uncharacterized protein TRAVEDRAFT_53550 [Trametes versicolor FP-101664 SS1]EIW53138.1 hypothetical protein TRAVEDRAFT_53550 [Trametes versicolor FP-101664 SS1]